MNKRREVDARQTGFGFVDLVPDSLVVQRRTRRGSADPTRDTLADARALMRSEDPPEVCPCCGTHRPVIYQRTLYSSMARALRELAVYFVRHPQDRSVHALQRLMQVPMPPEVKAGLTGGVHSKLVYWGLIEEDVDAGRGYYRMTDRGWQFVRGHLSVPRYVQVCGGRVIGESEERITMREACGEKFDLDELLETRR